MKSLKNILTTKTIALALLLLAGTLQAQVMNLDFEALTPKDALDERQPLNWLADSPIGFHSTQDAFEGKGALLIHSWYNHVPTRAWINAQQTERTFRNDIEASAMPIDARPVALQGYFKHTEVVDNGEPADVKVTLFRKTEDGMEKIGFGKQKFHATDEYKPFAVAIDYSDAHAQPTHISIEFWTGGGRSVGEPLFNYLYIDGLKLETATKAPGCRHATGAGHAH